jgi:hypothetical protein
MGSRGQGRPKSVFFLACIFRVVLEEKQVNKQKRMILRGTADCLVQLQEAIKNSSIYNYNHQNVSVNHIEAISWQSSSAKRRQTKTEEFAFKTIPNCQLHFTHTPAPLCIRLCRLQSAPFFPFQLFPTSCRAVDLSPPAST